MSLSVDTNVLVYGIDAKAGSRHDQAGRLIDGFVESGRGILILQTLAEFYSVATRKLGTPREVARGFVEDLRVAVDVHPADARALTHAMAAVEDHDLSFWDALLWATADRAGIRYLLSEDFQDGRTLGGVTFVNPFDRGNRQLLERELPAMRPGSPHT